MNKSLSFIDQLIAMVKIRDSEKDGHDPLIGHLLNLKELIILENDSRIKTHIIKGGNLD